MDIKGECGECPVCGGPTWIGEEDPYETGDLTEDMEFCWNECYYHFNDYGDHSLRIGDRELRWKSRDYWLRWSDRPSAEIDRAVEELRAQRRSAYKEPEAQRFLAVLDRDRFDRDTRMVFADWLEEHGYDEAVVQRGWTREWQVARDHLLLCAAECRISYNELLDAATAHREGGDRAALSLGHLTPEIMSDTETFWRAYQAVTGRDTGGENGYFVRCAC